MVLSSQFDDQGFKYQQHTERTGQRSLFQVSPEHRAPDRRWPRGYTPLAKDLVNRATLEIESHSQDWHEGFFAEDQLRQNLARSGAPIRDIESVGKWVLHSEQPGGKLEHRPRTNGMFVEKDTIGAGWFRDGSAIHLRSGMEGTATALHELGHAASARIKRPSAAYDTPRLRGEEEARAQNYAQDYTMTGGYKKKPSGPVEATESDAYFRGKAWAGREADPSRRNEFLNSYIRHRYQDPPRQKTEKPAHEQDELFDGKHPQYNWRTEDDWNLPDRRADWVHSAKG